MRLFLENDGSYNDLRVDDAVSFRVEGSVVMISTDSMEVEVTDVELLDANTVEDAAKRAARSLGVDSLPGAEPWPG